ncbi:MULTISPECIES: DUF2238 domain-containing protein [unclassified Acinetobacter]|uniref:DUF2238 domain-containing protein n=2 Tax=Acinetobacter TaxID=469 RepID=UPI0035B71AF2
MNKIKYLNLFWVILCVALATINPLDMHDYLLHQAGTLIMIGILLYYNRFIQISNLSFSLYCFGFLTLHIFAAHWLYSSVPYNEWLIQLFNFDLDKTFGWQRNMFDRVVHFGYGLLVYPFFYQVFAHYFKTLSKKQLAFIVLMWVMASSMLYELIEWALAMSLSPEQAEAYNGQQGDMWDAHKDMLIATIGAIMMACFYPKKH